MTESRRHVLKRAEKRGLKEGKAEGFKESRRHVLKRGEKRAEGRF